MSVFELANIAKNCGAVFVRDPWSQRLTLDNSHRVPRDVLHALRARWDDLEALVSEHEPTDPVAIAQRLLKRRVTA
jgi:hypothetical protein